VLVVVPRGRRDELGQRGGGGGRRILAAGAALLLLGFGGGDLHDLCRPDLLAQRAGELDGVDVVAHDDDLVPGVAGERHGVHPARGRHQRQRLGPAPVALHVHPDHDLLLRQGGSMQCMPSSVLVKEERRRWRWRRFRNRKGSDYGSAFSPSSLAGSPDRSADCAPMQASELNQVWRAYGG